MTASKVSNNQKITIVTVCYNAADVIENTIKSVINQTYDNVEYIIVDGASTDGTVDIIKRYSDRISYWVSEPDKGIYYAMNKAVDVATGDYINFMNAGDVFFDDNVLKEVFDGKTFIEDVIYGSNLLHFTGGYKCHHPSDIKYMATEMPFCHQSSFTKASVLKAYKFDTMFRSAADCMFFRKLYNNGGTFRRVKKYISVFDVYGFSSNCSMSTYFETCLALTKKPTIWGYFNRFIQVKWRIVRYCKLKFIVSERTRPHKYSCSRSHFKQMQDE